MTRRALFVSYLTVLAALMAVPAHAYIDPASGSMLLQFVIAGLAVAGTAVATFWQRIRKLLRRTAD